MTHPIKPTVLVTLGGKQYELLYSFDAIAEAEEVVDRPLITGLRGRDITTPTVNLVRAMFYGCAKTATPELTWEQAKALITQRNIADVWVNVLRAWNAAQPDPEDSARP
jgi:hypothetical protein